MKNKERIILKNITRIVTVMFCLMLISGCVATILTKNNTTKEAEPTSSSQEINAKHGKTSARLVCAGDNLIHQQIALQAQARSANGGYDFSPAYAQVKDIISSADVAFLNQEVAIVPSQPVSHYPLFNSPPELLDNMIDLGFDVFNQATNHIIDKYVSGAIEDYELFHSKQNIILTGLYKTWDEMFNPQTITKNDITFSFCAFTESLNGLQIPQGEELGIVSLNGNNHTDEENYAAMEKIIKMDKDASDIVCVSMHWIDENITEPDDSQKMIAQKLVDYGADIIIGTGPHVLQPIEYMTRADGSKALVIWSLGNFISTQADFPNTLGGIADIVIEKDYDTNSVSISSVGFIPTVAHYEAGRANVRIIPFSEYTNELALSHGSGNLTYERIDSFMKEMYGDFLRIDKKES